MKRYVIERDLPGAGKLTTEQIRTASQGSVKALSDLGTGIQWMRSHVTKDRIYCEYLAENEALVIAHAERAGLPATKISEVARVIDPMAAMPQGA
jgi:hypothetical protein